MNQRTKTNIHLDAQITGASPDAQYDHYNTSDGQRDLNYTMSKFLDVFSALNGSALTECILNTNGGIVTDSGSGQVDISALYGIGLASDGSIRPVYIPALTNVSLPTGWNDGRPIWVVAKHQFIVTGSTRSHAKFPAQSYNYSVIDSYYGNADSTLLFADSAPAAGSLILGKFTMAGTTYANLNVRSQEAILKNSNIDTIKLMFSGVSGSFIKTDASGSVLIYSNAYLDTDNSTIRIKTTGHSRRFRIDGATGVFYSDRSQDGVAGDVASYVTIPMILPGSLSGGIEFNTNALPPTIKAGTREINGIPWQLAADHNLTLAEVIGNCSQTLSDYSYQWIFTLIRASDGAKMWCPAYDIASPVGTGRTVTGVTVTSGTAVVATANTTGLVVADGHVIVVMLSDGSKIAGQLTAVSAGVSVSLKTSLADGTYSAGTYDAYYRIYTAHAGGAGIIVDADVGKYTPSPPFCAALNCYIVDQYGRPTATAADVYARITGIQLIGAAGAAGAVVSYKAGNNKNDNRCRLIGLNATQYGSTDTKVLRWSLTHAATRMWGSDWILRDSAANATIFEPQRIGTMRMQYNFLASAGVSYPGITKNAAEPVTLAISGVTDETAIAFNGSGGANDYSSASTPIDCAAGDKIRCQTSGTAVYTTNPAKLIMEFDI